MATSSKHERHIEARISALAALDAKLDHQPIPNRVELLRRCRNEQRKQGSDINLISQLIGALGEANFAVRDLREKTGHMRQIDAPGLIDWSNL